MIRSIVAICILLFGSSLHAQQAGSRDFTENSSQPANNDVPLPSCEHGRVSNNDGLMVSRMRDKFALSIEDLSSRLIPIGTAFTVTLRLKNASPNPVRIPWATSLREAIADQSPNSLDYLTSTLSLKVETGVESKRITALQGEAVLYGADSNPGSMLQLAPGQWATLRVRAMVRCRWKSQDSSICPAFRPDAKARLTADWSESEYTLTNSDCDIQRGNFAGPRVESRPEIVALTRP